MMFLPFMMTPSITVVSFLNDQFSPMSLCRWSLLSGQPAIIKHFNHCKCLSCATAHCICWINMHSGTSADICTASTLMLMSCMASSLFSSWLCQDSQSAIKIFGPGLYSILTQYWCILLCERVATSFLNIATRGL